MIKKNILYLMLTAVMLSLGNTALGTTYYLFAGNDDGWAATPSHWSRKAYNSSSEFSVTLEAGDWYMGISESDNVNNIYGCGCTGDNFKVSDPDNVTSWKGAQEWGGRQVYKFGLGSAMSLTISYDGATLTLRSNTTYYTVSTANDGHCSISPTSRSIAEGGSYTFTVTPAEGYALNTASLSVGSGNATCTPASGFSGSTTAKNVTISSVTGACTLSATTTARTQYTLTAPVHNGCDISPSSAQYVYNGDPITYTVTPTGTNVYKGSIYSGTKSGDIEKSDNTFTFYPTSNGTFTVTYGTLSSYVPVARIGNKIKMDGADVAVSGYVTSEKCYDVDEIVVYYSNNSAFRTEGSMVAKSKSFTPEAPDTEFALNEVHELILPAEDVETIVGNGETLYVRIKAHNEEGYSAYSDVVSLVYENNNFEASSVSITPSDACDGNHEFTWSNMFLPTPTSYAVIDDGGNNAMSEFTLTDDGKMVWNVIESIDEDGTINIKPDGTYTFTFTAKRNGYTSADAVLTIYFATTGTEDSITGIEFNSEGVKTEDGSLTPWETASLGATESSSAIEKIGWTVSPESDNYVLTPTEGTSVKFKAKTAGTYTVTARGLTSTCGSSVSKKIELTVNNDSEPCGN